MPTAVIVLTYCEVNKELVCFSSSDVEAFAVEGGLPLHGGWNMPQDEEEIMEMESAARSPPRGHFRSPNDVRGFCHRFHYVVL